MRSIYGKKAVCARVGMVGAAGILAAATAHAGPVVDTKTFLPATNASWAVDANWSVGNGAGYPSGAGAGAIFQNNQTSNRSVTLDAPIILSSLSMDAQGFTNVINTGTGSLNWTAATTGGNVTITTNPVSTSGTATNTIATASTANDNIVANVGTGGNASGSLNWTGSLTGAGGFTKNGDGLATFGTNAKTYTGPTVLNGGRLRQSFAGNTTQTSSYTINAGGQLDFIAAGTFTLGTGNLNLNGSGPTSGPFAANPGAIRPDANLLITITNNTVLQSDTTIINSGTTVGASVLTFQGNMSGTGQLIIGDPGATRNGAVTLTGTDTYQGGTSVTAETLNISGTNSSVGTGNVHLIAGSSASVLAIASGVTNAIADTATLTIDSGGSNVNVGTGISEQVAGLVLGGVAQPDGVYNSTTSPGFITGAGQIVVQSVPEPTALGLIGIGAAGLLRRRQRKA